MQHSKNDARSKVLTTHTHAFGDVHTYTSNTIHSLILHTQVAHDCRKYAVAVASNATAERQATVFPDSLRKTHVYNNGGRAT